MYRLARSRALGRGAAQMVSVSAGASGAMNVKFEVREAIQPNDPALTVGTCGPLPVSSCLATDWSVGAVGQNRLVDTFPKEAALYANIEAKLVPSGSDGEIPGGQLCFTPTGRAFFRPGPGTPWVSMVDVPRIIVKRKDTDGSYIGLTRTVLLPPSGAARLAL